MLAHMPWTDRAPARILLGAPTRIRAMHGLGNKPDPKARPLSCSAGVCLAFCAIIIFV